MYLLYRSRHVISWLPAIVIGGCILLVSRQAVLQVTPHYDDSAIVLSLAEPEPPAPIPVQEPEPEPEPESPPPEPIQQPLPEPEPIEAPVVEEQVPVIAPKPVVKPQPKPQPKPKPKPVVKSTPKPQPAITPSRPPVSSAPSVMATPSSPPVAKINVQAVESGYLQALRSELEQRKRYPNGRQASLERPQGNVEVWLEIDRSGKVLASGIAQKAPSMLLNRAALGSLQSISQVKPFPNEAFAGQRTKRFTATFNYQAP